MKNSTKGIITVVVVLLLFTAVGMIFFFSNRTTKASYDEFRNYVDENVITEVNVNNDTVKFKIKGDNKIYECTTWDTFLKTEIDKLLAYENVPKIEFNNRYAGNIWSYIWPILMAVVAIVFFVYLFKAMGGRDKQALSFGRTKTNIAHQKVRFTDVAGAEEEKEELKEVVDFLKSPQKFSNLGARIPKGILLVGPPGTGKTLFAKAVAGEAGVPFFSISGSDFVEMFVGVGASRVRDLFDQAKKNMPCIVFIDEIDAVGRQRGAGLGGGHDEREQTLNQLLVQMDGFETNEGIIVMAATNRADILDPALLRPGRFDRQIYVNVPDVRGREAIFKVHSRNKPMSAEIDFKILARITSGFSGADIENLLNEAAILCARDGRKSISMEDVYEGINKVVMGPKKKSRLVTEVDKRITAYHESGHAIVAKCHPNNTDLVNEISIIPRGQAAGYNLLRPDDDNEHIGYNKLCASLAIAMGGRAAEELVIQDITTGAVGDIQNASSLARKMVTEWGMSKNLGPVYYGEGHEVFLGRDYGATHSYSDEVGALIDKEVTNLLEKAHKEALEILSSRREIMDTMVRVLIECETIYADEIDMIMDGKSAERVKAAINRKYKEKQDREQNLSMSQDK